MVWTIEMVENLTKLVSNYERVSQQRNMMHLVYVNNDWIVSIKDMSYFPYSKPDNIRQNFIHEIPPKHPSVEDYEGI